MHYHQVLRAHCLSFPPLSAPLFMHMFSIMFGALFRALSRRRSPSVTPCPPLSQRNTVSRPLITCRLCSVGCGFGELGMTSYILDSTKPESHNSKLDYIEMEMKRRLKCGSTVAFPRRELLIMQAEGASINHISYFFDTVPPCLHITKPPLLTRCAF